MYMCMCICERERIEEWKRERVWAKINRERVKGPIREKESRE